MKRRSVFLFALVGGVLLTGGGAQAGEPLGGPMDFTNAGLRIAAPAGAQPIAPIQPTCLYVGQNSSARVSVYAVLSNAPAPAQTDQAVAEKITTVLAGKPTQTEFQLVASQAAKAGATTVWQAAGRAEDNSACVAANVWNVSKPALQKNLQYAVVVRRADANTVAAQKLSQAILASASPLPLAEPWAAPLPPMSVSASLPEEGFALELPLGWHVKKRGRHVKSNVVLGASTANYIGGASPYVNITVSQPLTGRAPDVHTASYAEQLIAGMEKRLTKLQWRATGSALIRLDGAKALRVTATAEVGGTKLAMALCQAFHGGRVYTLTATYPLTAKARAEEMLAAWCETFRFTDAAK